MLELNEEEYERAVGLRSPLLPIEHETFQPGGPLVARSNSFPFLLSLVRATSDYRVRARVRGNRPWYAELYEPGNVTQGHELMVALAGAFMDQTHRRGQKGLLLFLPPEWVLRYHSESGYWIHQPLLNALDEADIPYLDFGPFLESHSVDPVNEPFIEHGGHYGQEGDRLLAKMILAELRARFPEAAAGGFVRCFRSGLALTRCGVAADWACSRSDPILIRRRRGSAEVASR